MRLLALLLLPSLALAQTGGIVTAPVPPRGVTLPPTNAALVDEATALSLNPAGLGFYNGAQLFYLHERDLERDALGDAVFVGGRLLGLGLGASMEWIRGRNEADYRKTSLGLSLGSRTLRLGASWHDIDSDNRTLDALSGLDLGLTARPMRALSLAAVVRDINASEEDGLKLPRAYNFGVGVRPLDERYTLGVDWYFQEGAFRQGRATYTLNTEVVPGIRLGAGVSHGFTEGVPLALQFAATLDTGGLGLTYAGGGGENGLDHVVAVRLSTDRYRGLRRPGGTVALLDLDDMLSGGGSFVLSWLGAGKDDPYLRLMQWLALAEKDPRLTGVVVKLEGLPGVGWGKADELRQSLLRLRRSGKKVLAVLLDADDRGMYVASAADRIYTLPEADLTINGLSASLMTIGGTMRRLGIHWDAARVGDYKTATDQLTRDDISEPERETTNAYLDTQVAAYVKAVTDARKVPRENLETVWRAGLPSSQLLKDQGLVDGIIIPSDLDAKVAELMPGAAFNSTYAPRDERDDRWGRRRRIAVVPVVGSISGGRSREDPLGYSDIAGAETVMRALDSAQSDPSVVAIVLRVDSPGGGVLASHLMYQSVLEAAKHKPVVATMGDLAASGGYYAAVAADEIFALPSTLTGSIGVFYLKPAFKGLLGDTLGVAQETVKRAPLADILDYWTPWTPEHQAAAQAWADSSYDIFISEVAKQRKMDKAKVDAVARGRVWSGEDALARGLVDKLGGLPEALDSARKRAGVSPSEDLDIVVMGDARGFLSSLGGEPGVQAALRLLPEPPSPFPDTLRSLAREAGVDLELLRPGMKAMLPFTFTVR